jgi:hypothetical protein
MTIHTFIDGDYVCISWVTVMMRIIINSKKNELFVLAIDLIIFTCGEEKRRRRKKKKCS